MSLNDINIKHEDTELEVLQKYEERFGTVRFILDFRELNTRIKRKSFPILKNQHLLLKLEGLSYYIMSCFSETFHNSITVGQL